MKTAVIYYSYDGNTCLVAGIIGAALNANIFEIKTADTKKRSGFAKYAWGGSQVFMRKKPALLPLSFDPAAFDFIILGTPVWAASPAPALVSFIDKYKINGKKTALFCCHGGGKGNTFGKLKTLLKGNTFAGEIDFENPAKTDSAVLRQKIGEWVRGLSF